MELIRLEEGGNQAINMFEYNSHPPKEVQNLWFTTWVNHAKLEFDLKVAQFGRNPETIRKLAGLFKESLEVLILADWINLVVTLNLGFPGQR